MGPKDAVTLADLDSVFLGDIIDPDMKGPKCGALTFIEEGEGPAGLRQGSRCLPKALPRLARRGVDGAWLP
jgi:hypothetical protein